jgi:hypothetical protein
MSYCSINMLSLNALLYFEVIVATINSTSSSNMAQLVVWIGITSSIQALSIYVLVVVSLVFPLHAPHTGDT